MKKFREIFNVNILAIAMCVYIMLQPALDILSFMDIRNLIPFGISTYIKPIFIFGMALIIYVLDKKQRKKWTLLFVAYGVLMVVHSLILRKLSIETGVILHEIRFMVNIAYMLVLYMIFDYLFSVHPDKEKLKKNLKGYLVITFIVYCVTIILAIITGTSANTYEYSDAAKLGFKGWLDSGQIFGHALSIILPFMVYYLFNKNTNNTLKNVGIKLLTLLPAVVLYLIGTKVTYFICAIVLASHVILDFIFWFRNKESRNLLVSSLSCLLILGVFLGTYKFSPVYYNTEINNAVLDEEISQALIKRETDREDIRKMQEYMNEVNAGTKKMDLVSDYYNADIKATWVLQNEFAAERIHPNDNRKKQLVYNFNKFMFAGPVYKLFGLGYLNQPTSLSIERDILMVTFSLGIVGAFTVLLFPIKTFVGATVSILRRLKKVKLETLYLYEGLGIFFGISFYAGYTFIYTNFSIFLVALMFLLKENITKEKEEERSVNAANGKEKVLGFDVCNLDKGNLVDNIFKDFDAGEKLFIVNINPEIATNNYKNKEFVEKFNKQKYQIPDGIGIVLASKMKNGNIKSRITGIDLMLEICRRSVKHNCKIFLYGANIGVADKAKLELEKDIAGINIVGSCDGYGKESEAIAKINASGANVLFVALGCPKQENFILNNMEKLINVKIFMPVGGSFDVLSKNIKRAPSWVQKLNLEWLYRLCKEPKRFFRQLSLIKFVFLAAFK